MTGFTEYLYALEVECDNDPGWRRNLDIFRAEQDYERRRFSVSVRSLFSTAECVYTYPDGEMEFYDLKIISDSSFPYFQLWRNVNGWLNAVPFETVPFSYDELRLALLELPGAQEFLAQLLHPTLKWLASLKFSLDRIVAVSGYLRYEYPRLYTLILASSREVIPLQGVIDRQILARCLGVSALSSGQLTIMRKLDVEESNIENVMRATVCIAQRWLSLKSLLAHERCIHPETVLLLDYIVSNAPAVLRCRWFSYPVMDSWIAHYFQDGRCIRENPKSVAALFLVEWHFLLYRNVTPASLDSANRMERILQREWALILHEHENEEEASQFIREHTISSIDPEFREDANRALDILINDYAYNSKSDFSWADDAFFPLSKVVANDYFKPVTTAGELRDIAKHLDNCAATRVEAGMDGRAEFWFYDDLNEEMNEVALLQIDPRKYFDKRAVVEFLGPSNCAVSEKAVSQMSEWIKQCKNNRENGHETRT
jgi:hypothetical protein